MGKPRIRRQAATGPTPQELEEQRRLAILRRNQTGRRATVLGGSVGASGQAGSSQSLATLGG